MTESEFQELSNKVHRGLMDTYGPEKGSYFFVVFKQAITSRTIEMCLKLEEKRKNEQTRA